MTGNNSLLPWNQLLRISAERCHWPPDAFWKATPKELSAAIGLDQGTVRMNRVRLDELVRRHPDIRKSPGF